MGSRAGHEHLIRALHQSTRVSADRQTFSTSNDPPQKNQSAFPSWDSASSTVAKRKNITRVHATLLSSGLSVRRRDAYSSLTSLNGVTAVKPAELSKHSFLFASKPIHPSFPPVPLSLFAYPFCLKRNWGGSQVTNNSQIPRHRLFY